MKLNIDEIVRLIKILNKYGKVKIYPKKKGI